MKRTVTINGQEWKVWRGTNGRWYGTSEQVPGKAVDAPTLRCAKMDIRLGYFVAG